MLPTFGLAKRKLSRSKLIVQLFSERHLREIEGGAESNGTCASTPSLVLLRVI